MSPSRGDDPRHRGYNVKSWSQEKVESAFYSLGLCCSTYPISVLIVFVTVLLICSYPLVHLPLPGQSPQQTWLSSLNLSDSVGDEQPFCYIQQVVMRVAVLPWEEDLTLGDAFRAPLYEAFKLLEVVRNYQDKLSGKTLGHACLHIEAITINKRDRQNVLPQYSCLVLSPANFWNQDVNKFAQDSSILTTVYNYHSFQKGKVSIAEMLFGMNLYDTGIKRYPLRNRQRVIQYAITLFLKEFDKGFIEGLYEKLIDLYPLHQNSSTLFTNGFNDTVFLKYPGEINYIELVPIVISFILLFWYYYFYVKKIDVVRSKFGMALTATTAVLFGLGMNLGICFFFDLTLNFHGGRGIFPYLTVLLGLENVLVLTKSVAATPSHLDVKIRIAQALSKEGWPITKNILLEITILTIGLFTCVPVIQKLCIFSIVGLLTDFFSQIFFFLIIFGIDLARMENSMERTNQNFRSGLYQSQSFYDKSRKGMVRSKSHPRLSTFPANIVAAQQHPVQEKKVPKRLRFVNIWARTRFFQRSFMILMVFWICAIIYNSDIINNYILNVLEERNVERQNDSKFTKQNFSTIGVFPRLNTKNSVQINYVTYNPLDAIEKRKNHVDDLDKLKHPEYAPWLKLPFRHWPLILQRYNISISGETLVILPNIKLSHMISPEEATALRNPDENYGEKFQWQALAAALDPLDFSVDKDPATDTKPLVEQPFYPSSPMEIIILTILCLISVMVLAYTVVVLYRCVCSRNYAEWRASWFPDKSEDSDQDQVLLEAIPVVLEGHCQEIECIATDGLNLVSVCLGGKLKVWDNSTGELITNIDRNSYFQGEGNVREAFDDDVLSDYESSSPPSRDDVFPRLVNRIHTRFSGAPKPEASDLDSKYEFNKSFRYYYFDHKYDVRNKQSEKTQRKRDSGSSDNRNNEGEARAELDRQSSNSSGNISCKASPIWCVDFVENLIVAGRADGRLEFWEATTGKLKYIFEDGNESGINSVKMLGSKVVASRLCGTLDFFQLQNYNQGRPVDWNFTCAYRRTHIRTGSMGSINERDLNQTDSEEDLRCVKILGVRAHRQPITCLDCEGGRVVTGGQDHVLKVYRLEDGGPLYTLHGHSGPITCLFIDRICPSTSGSGSQDGTLCVWDLLSGACEYSIRAHDGTVLALTYSASYVISLGADERLCVWERFQGHLLNAILVGQAFSAQVLMLAPHLVAMGRGSGLVVWDVRTGECVRTIALGREPYVFINQLILLRDAVLCDYGTQLRIVRFPLITHKFD